MKEEITTIGRVSCYLLNPYEQSIVRRLADEELTALNEELQEHNAFVEEDAVYFAAERDNRFRVLRLVQSVLYKYDSKRGGFVMSIREDQA